MLSLIHLSPETPSARLPLLLAILLRLSRQPSALPLLLPGLPLRGLLRLVLHPLLPQGAVRRVVVRGGKAARQLLEPPARCS